MAELDRTDESSLHGAFHVSIRNSAAQNGVKRCSVQIECEAGCGYLIQAFGEEADMLQEKAIVLQRLLQSGQDIKSFSYALLSLFPEL
jgi:hypothetical protein